MQTIKIFLLSSLLLSSAILFGQKIEFRPGIGLCTYAMSDFRTLLKQSATESAAGLETIEEFPAYYSFHSDVIFFVSPKIGIGLTSGLYSTGARNSIADYSGYYYEDIVAKALNFGLIGVFKDSLKDDLFYGIEICSGIKLSDMTLESKIKLNDLDYADESKMDLTGKGWWIEPRIRFGWNFYKSFNWSVYGGYEFHLKNKMSLKENSQMQMAEKIDWSGFRFGLGLSFVLNN